MERKGLIDGKVYAEVEYIEREIRWDDERTVCVLVGE